MLFDKAGGGALSHKSRYQDARVAVAVLTEALNTGKAGGQLVNSYWLAWLDNHPGDQLWLAGTGTAGRKRSRFIYVIGDYYGYQVNAEASWPRRLSAFRSTVRSHGDALRIPELPRQARGCTLRHSGRIALNHLSAHRRPRPTPATRRRPLDREHAAEERAVAAQRLAQILGRDVVAPVPLALEPRLLVGEDFGHPLDRQGDQAVGGFDGLPRLRPRSSPGPRSHSLRRREVSSSAKRGSGRSTASASGLAKLRVAAWASDAVVSSASARLAVCVASSGVGSMVSGITGLRLERPHSRRRLADQIF